MVYDVVVVGAGIVGLATAWQLHNFDKSLNILVLEKEDRVAAHQTGNNSGVIHSGIYYKPGSLKAKNCKRGYRYLIDFCNEEQINYNLCGKVIVATSDDEVERMNSIYERGVQNGLEGIEILDANGVNDIEPQVNAVAGIKVPQTGIINFTDVCNRLAKKLKNSGADIRFNSTVVDIKENENEVVVHTNNEKFVTGKLVSCAGLHSDRIAKMTHPEHTLRIIPFRGEYYKLAESKRSLVKTLVYPVPNPAFPFLGVHFTNIIDGGVEAGPNAVLAFKREGYSKFSFSLNDTIETFAWKGFRKVMSKYLMTGMGEFYRSYNKQAFVKALRKLIPAVNSGDLVTGGAGVRAQACDKSSGLVDDFAIVGGGNIYHVCNAPSPAATASLSIGKYIAEKILDLDDSLGIELN